MIKPPPPRPRPPAIPKHQVEVLLIAFPQNDYLDPKGTSSSNSFDRGRLNQQRKHALACIKLLRSRRLFDHVVVLRHEHYGNNLSFASCMVGTSLGEIVHYACSSNISTKIQKERTVFGRWGAKYHSDFILDPMDHEFVVGMDPLVGDSPAFSSSFAADSGAHLLRGSSRWLSTDKVVVDGETKARERLKTTCLSSSARKSSHPSVDEGGGDLKQLLRSLGTTRLFFSGVVLEHSFTRICLEGKISMRVPFVVIPEACINLSPSRTMMKNVKGAKLAFIDMQTLMGVVLEKNHQKLIASDDEHRVRPLPPRDENDVELRVPNNNNDVPIELLEIIRIRHSQRVSGKKMTMPSQQVLAQSCGAVSPNSTESATSALTRMSVHGGTTSCLHLLCAEGDETLLRYVFQCLSSSSLNLAVLNDKGMTPMMVSIESGHYECVHLLAKERERRGEKSLLFDVNYRGRTTLMTACAFGENEQVALLLLQMRNSMLKSAKKMGRINTKQEENGQEEISRLITAQDLKGHSALHYVCAGSPVTPGRIAIVRDLLSSVNSIVVRMEMLNKKDVRGWSALHLMAKNGMLPYLPWDLVARNLSALPFEELTLEGHSLIHLAAWNGHDLAVRMLVSSETRVSAEDHHLHFKGDFESSPSVSSSTRGGITSADEKKSNSSSTSPPMRLLRAPWIDIMPKNILIPMTQWSELDACLLRGYTHSAAWLCRSGYIPGPNLSQGDIDFFTRRIIQQGDIKTFFSLLKSPAKVTLNADLIRLIASMDTLAHRSGNFTTEFRRWVPIPIEISVRALHNATKLKKYAEIPKNVIEIIAKGSHDIWAQNAKDETPMLIQRGARGTEFHTHLLNFTEELEKLDMVSIVEKGKQEEEEEEEEKEEKEEKEEEKEHDRVLVGVNYDQLKEPKKRSLRRVVKRTIMSIQSLGFELVGLENAKKAARRQSQDFKNDIEHVIAFSFIPHEEHEKVYRSSPHRSPQKLSDDNYINAVSMDVRPSGLIHDDTPTNDQMSRLQKVLAINIHNLWAFEKKGKGWMYGKQTEEMMSNVLYEMDSSTTGSSTSPDDHKDYLRNEDVHVPQQVDERLVPFAHLMTVYKMRCEILASQTVKILRRLGIHFRLRDETGGTYLDHAWDRLHTNDEYYRGGGGNGGDTTPSSDTDTREDTRKTVEQVRQKMMDHLLRRAVRENNVEAARQLLTPDTSESNTGAFATVDSVDDDNQRTVLHYAVLYGHVDILHLLLRVGADSGVRDRSGITPLHLAAFLGHEDMVQCLIEEGGVSTVARDRHGWAAIHHASYANHPASVRRLSFDLIGPGRPGIDFVDGVAQNWMELQSQAKKKVKKNKTIINSVVQKKKNLRRALGVIMQHNVENFITPLTLSVQRLSLEAATELIYQGADPTMIDSTGVSPYDRALLMADELSGRIDTLDKKVQAIIDGSLWSSTIYLISNVFHSCCGHCRRCRRCRREDDEDSRSSAQLQRRAISFSLFNTTASGRSATLIQEHERELQSLTRLRDSLVVRHKTVVDVLHCMLSSTTVQNLRWSFSLRFFFKFVLRWLVLFLVVLFFSPMSITDDWRSKNVFDATARVKAQVRSEWNHVRETESWIHFHLDKLNDWWSFEYVGVNPQVMTVIGSMKIEARSFETLSWPSSLSPSSSSSSSHAPSTSRLTCTLPGGTTISPCYRTKYSSDAPEYWGDQSFILYLNPSGNTTNVSESLYKSRETFQNARKLTTTLNIYHVQLKVLMELKMYYQRHPTGAVTTSLEIDGGLLPSGLETRPWSQRHAPSKLFVSIYTLLFVGGLGLVYYRFKIQQMSFYVWISSKGNLFSLLTTFLTLAITLFDLLVAGPSLSVVVNGILNSTPTTYLKGVEDYLSSQNIERQLFSVQAIVIWIPLLFCARMLPRVGPNVVAVLNAVANWEVGLYISFLFFITLVVSTALYVAFGRESVHFLLMEDGFVHLLRLPFAEEFNNIQHVGTRPLVTIYSIMFLVVVFVMLNIFLAIVSERYLAALDESQKKWEDMITTTLEQDRRSRRNNGWNKGRERVRYTQGWWWCGDAGSSLWYRTCCGRCSASSTAACCSAVVKKITKHFTQTSVEFRGNLWTSAMQNVLIQTRVVGKESADAPQKTKKRLAKQFRILGHAIHLDASTSTRLLKPTKSEVSIRKRMIKMDTTLSELSTLLRDVNR